jgi:hypothetical protein
MSGVIVASECTAGGSLWWHSLTISVVWTSLLWQNIDYIVKNDRIYGEIKVGNALPTSSFTFMITVSDWIQRKIQPHYIICML